ncbi:hypothetical protein Dimus_024398, partial [Dionaea muscipula]
MEPGELHKMFEKFGVVKDVFILRKRSRAGRRFGFVRYDCSVAAEVAISHTNGIWIHDKELKVKCADYARNQTRRPTATRSVAGTLVGFSSSWPCPVLEHPHQKASFDQWFPSISSYAAATRNVGMVRGRISGRTMGRGGVQEKTVSWSDRVRVKQVWVPVRKELSPLPHEPSDRMAGIGSEMRTMLPMVKVNSIGNGWLHRSVVAEFANHRSTEFMFVSFMENSEGNFNILRMGGKKVLITFSSEMEMNAFIDQHNQQKLYRFDSVAPWFVGTEYSFGREVWLSCYGVHVHAWNVSTFCSIGNVWGEVVMVQDDTAKCARFDVGKIKVLTHNMSVINQELKLMVGSKMFGIRVAEEQAVFICDDEVGEVHEHTLGSEDEQKHSSKWNGGDDDVVEGGDGFLGNRDADSASFIEESHDELENGKEGERSFQSVGGVDREGLLQAQDMEVTTAEHPLQVLPSARADLVLRVIDDIREHTNQRQPQGVTHGCGLGLHAQGSVQEVGSDEGRPMSFQVGPYLNSSGINLEVVLGDGSGRTCCDLSRRVTEDICRGKSVGEGDKELDGVPHLDDDHAISQPEFCPIQRTRKRGRPKKSKVIEDAAAMAESLSSSTILGAGKNLSWKGRAVQGQSGEGRAEQRQNNGGLACKLLTSDECVELTQDDDAGANLQLDRCRNE